MNVIVAESGIEDHLKTLQSGVGFHELIERLLVAIERRYMVVYARIDLAKDAETVAVSMRPAELLIVGYPAANAPIIARHPSFGVILPTHMLVWENESGLACLTYTDLMAEARALRLPENTENQLKAIALSMAGIAQEATEAWSH